MYLHGILMFWKVLNSHLILVRINYKDKVIFSITCLGRVHSSLNKPQCCICDKHAYQIWLDHFIHMFNICCACWHYLGHKNCIYILLDFILVLPNLVEHFHYDGLVLICFHHGSVRQYFSGLLILWVWWRRIHLLVVLIFLDLIVKSSSFLHYICQRICLLLHMFFFH